MGIETRILNLFLHQRTEGTEKRIWMAYNFTTKDVYSWKESLSHGGTNGSGSIDLGLNSEPEKISQLIRKRIEKIHFSSPVAQIYLFNEGDYEGGKKDKLDEQQYHKIHSFLRSNSPKIYFEPMIFCCP